MTKKKEQEPKRELGIKLDDIGYKIEGQYMPEELQRLIDNRIQNALKELPEAIMEDCNDDWTGCITEAFGPMIEKYIKFRIAELEKLI